MTLTPETVERLIDEAGREQVFRRARELGWGGSLPPLWVWHQIAAEIISGRATTEEKQG
jgi:hypothetical protein